MDTHNDSNDGRSNGNGPTNGTANGNGSTNGTANGNGSTNGTANGNGSTNGTANGKTNGNGAAEETNAKRLAALAKRRKVRKVVGRVDWSSWPVYDGATTGLRNYWYPVQWSTQVTRKPTAVEVCGEKLMLQRDENDVVRALHDRCPHRGVRLSQGTEEFPGTISCPYHGWTYSLETGVLVAVITDGPDSPMCGRVQVETYPTEEFLGMVWVFIGDREPHPLTDQLPPELVDAPPMAVGGRIEDRDGDWRLYAENGFDEGHAKYLHRTSKWRIFKTMPTWNLIHVEREGRWLYRVEDERHWEADFPGVGHWSNHRWWKIKPKQTSGKMLGNTGGSAKNDPHIAGQGFPGFVSLSLPGVLRVAYPNFIHYEFYVPIAEGRTKYVGVMVQFKSGVNKAVFFSKYLGGIRWLFHGDFSAQDHWMVAETDAPPERLYRPDVSLLEWRRLVEGDNPFDSAPETAVSISPEPEHAR